jgi:hypothetical protein
VIAHGAGAVFGQARGIVEQHQRVGRHVICGGPGAGGGVQGAAGPHIPAHAAAAQQARHEMGVAFVVLHGLFARRKQGAVEQGIERVVKGAAQHGISAPPFVEQHLHDIEFALGAENAAVDALFHDGHGVAQHQLVSGQAAVAVAGARFGDDAADAAQLAAVGDQLELGRQRNQFLQRQQRRAGQARDAVMDAAADRFRSLDTLRQEHVVEESFRMVQAQTQGTVGRTEWFFVLQDLQQFSRTVHHRSPCHDAGTNGVTQGYPHLCE